MTKMTVETRFNKARSRLSSALKELEEVVKEKIHEASELQVKITNTENDIDLSSGEGTNFLPSARLADEINNLQKSLSEVGKECELLREENDALVNRAKKFELENIQLIDAIEADLAKIEEIINNRGWMTVEVPVGKSSYKINCAASEREKILHYAAKLNQRINNLALKFGTGADEKTLLVIAALMMEDEIAELKKTSSAQSYESNQSTLTEDDVYEAVSENMENIADYVEKLVKKIRNY